LPHDGAIEGSGLAYDSQTRLKVVKSRTKETSAMDNKGYSAAEISAKLREADMLFSHGRTISQVCIQLGITESMFHDWRNTYGDADSTTIPNQSTQLRKLEAENARLERTVTILLADNLILKDVAEDNR
jgi:putative transposase